MKSIFLLSDHRLLKTARTRLMIGGTSLKQITQQKYPSLFHEIFSRYLFLLVLVYGLAVLIVAGQVKIGFIDDTLQKVDLPAEILLPETFGNENALFSHAILPKDRPRSIYPLMLEAMTNLRFDDIRSLFGSELPGFTIYNAKIFSAGKGLNYMNLPQDSPPPPQMNLPAPKPAAPAKKQANPNPQTNPMKKMVFLYHTHSWESYKPALAGQSNASGAVSADPGLDVIHDGTVIGQELAANGIGYVHDMSNKNVMLQQRGWNYNEAYQYSRIITQAAMKQNPGMTYLIDIHRDSSAGSITTLSLNHVSYARISFIIGEDNPNYSANLYLAKQIKSLLDQRYPGLVLGIIGKTKYSGDGVYNQDLSKNALLIEVGGVDNTLAEVDCSSKAFADALSAYIKKSNH